MDLHAGESDLTSADEDEDEEIEYKVFFRCTRDISALSDNPQNRQKVLAWDFKCDYPSPGLHC